MKKPSFSHSECYRAEVPKLEHTVESQGDLEKPLTLALTPSGSGVVLGRSPGAGRPEGRRLPGAAAVSHRCSSAEGPLSLRQASQSLECEASAPTLSLWAGPGPGSMNLTDPDRYSRCIPSREAVPGLSLLVILGLNHRALITVAFG